LLVEAGEDPSERRLEKASVLGEYEDGPGPGGRGVGSVEEDGRGAVLGVVLRRGGVL